jgi:hypothetical protein
LRDSDDDDGDGDSPCLADPQPRPVRVVKSIDWHHHIVRTTGEWEYASVELRTCSGVWGTKRGEQQATADASLRPVNE